MRISFSTPRWSTDFRVYWLYIHVRMFWEIGSFQDILINIRSSNETTHY